jgi:hypothetical protein
MFFPPSFISVLILNHQLMLHSSEKPFTQWKKISSWSICNILAITVVPL